METTVKQLTVSDFRELPEGPPYYQLIEGDFFMSPSPNRAHQDVLLNLAVALRKYLEEHPIGTVHIAPSDVELSEFNVYEPDLYFVSNGRAHILTDQGAAGAPDLVVEILSPKTARLDRGVKRRNYARAGVKELWLVDVEARSVEVFRFAEAAEEPVAVATAESNLTTPVLPGLELPLETIFQTPPSG